MEKTWQTDPNFTIATTASYLVMGQSVMMALKDRMVSEAGWTVVGSSDGTIFEYQGEVDFPTLKDVVGSNDGTMVDMEFADLQWDTAGGTFSTKSVLMDGIDEYATMGNTLGFSASDGFSFSFWFKTATDSKTFFSKLGPGTLWRGYSVYMTGSGAVGVQFNTDLTGLVFGYAYTNTSGYADNQWHHAVVTYNGSGSPSGFAIHIDGVSQSLSTGGTFTDITNTSAFLLGQGANAGTRYNGALDEVAVYDRALTPAEAAFLYGGGEPPDLSTFASASNLISWWRAELTGTTGGSYGGSSTGPYDVWEAIADIVRAPNGSSPGWCLLKSPDGDHGPFYALLAMEGTGDTDLNGYTWYSDQNWMLYPTTPTVYLPIRAEGAAAHGRSRYTFFQMSTGTQTTRGYFSGAPEDGSFIFAMNWTLYPTFTGLQMFHVMDSAHPTGVMPTCSYSHSSIAVASYVVNANYFYAYHPRYASTYDGDPTGGSGVRCVSTYPQYETTPILLTPMPTVNFEGNVDPFPLFLIAESAATEEGRSTFVGRVPDLYSAPTGLNEADTMPSASPEYFQFGDWLLPGDTTPLLGP